MWLVWCLYLMDGREEQAVKMHKHNREGVG